LLEGTHKIHLCHSPTHPHMYTHVYSLKHWIKQTNKYNIYIRKNTTFISMSDIRKSTISSVYGNIFFPFSVRIYN
jgi:hypothetical protein